jgi:hypothetical protein
MQSCRAAAFLGGKKKRRSTPVGAGRGGGPALKKGMSKLTIGILNQSAQLYKDLAILFRQAGDIAARFAIIGNSCN